MRSPVWCSTVGRRTVRSHSGITQAPEATTKKRTDTKDSEPYGRAIYYPLRLEQKAAFKQAPDSGEFSG
jgi:hypothetical protein